MPDQEVSQAIRILKRNGYFIDNLFYDFTKRLFLNKSWIVKTFPYKTGGYHCSLCFEEFRRRTQPKHADSCLVTKLTAYFEKEKDAVDPGRHTRRRAIFQLPVD